MLGMVDCDLFIRIPRLRFTSAAPLVYPSLAFGEHTARNTVAIMLIFQDHYEIASSRAVTLIACYTVGLIASSASRCLVGFSPALADALVLFTDSPAARHRSSD